MDERSRTEAEAYAFRRMVKHLSENSDDVQNIDLMITGDFCRNCLAKWLKEGLEVAGEEISYEDARSHIYGEPFEDWKAKHQKPATEDQLALIDAIKKRKADRHA